VEETLVPIYLPKQCTTRFQMEVEAIINVNTELLNSRL
jgi:hypothetical protein